ncbi:MAG: alpha/beta hydrolase [Desulfobacterales bacterium]|nr:MAG: alpha/beta hydrolase [Desulfobacterales bacterium]
MSFAASVYAMLHLLPLKDQKEVYEKFVFEPGRAVSEIGFWFFDVKSAAKVDEATMTWPVLVVSGAKNRITPAAMIKKVAVKYQTVATYKEFENHAHGVLSEPHWENIATFISDWLTSEIKS